MKKDDLKIGIALSGGGVRAVVFHLGVFGRLASDNLLERITFISTVSGGTLGVGLVYSIANNKWPSSDVYLNKCVPNARLYLTKSDIQYNALCNLFLKPWYILQGRSKLISNSIRKCWQVSGILKDIPPEPRWVINATAYESGKNWRFMPQRMGDYVLNYVDTPNMALSDAMAASAAYPGLIGPLILKTKKYKWFKFDQFSKRTEELCEPKFSKIHLWDGGVYDNLGVEALFKPKEQKYRDEYNFLIVSDASKGIEMSRPSTLLNRAYRLVEIAMDQVRSLRARSLVSYFREYPNSGVYLKIGNTAKYILEQTDITIDKTLLLSNVLSESQVKKAAAYATTLKKLSEEDFDLIYKHGWEIANFTLFAYCPDLFNAKNYR